MSDDYDDDQEEGGGGGGIPTEMILSYLAFGKRAILRRKWVILFVFSSLSALAIFVATVLPRTYHCEARLMAQRSQNLFVRGDDYTDALKGAQDVVLKHENLQAIVKQTNLVKVNAERKPPALKFKDKLMDAIRGPLSDKDQVGALVWTLESRLFADVDNSALTIGADWYDPQTSSDLVQAALDNFLESRHVAEISTGTEFISILEGHASRLRTEVETIAAQIRQLKDDKRKEKLAKAKGVLSEKVGSTLSTASISAPRRISVRKPGDDEETATLRTNLEAKQRQAADLDENRKRKLSEAQTKLNDLLQKFTSAHPSVMDTRSQIAQLSQESPQVAELKSEARSLEAELKRKLVARDGAVGALGTGGSMTRESGNAGAAQVEPLSADIMNLLEDSEEDLDPAVTAQFRYAVDKYASIRGQISSARVDLDTAQAAFKYRYNIVVPPEPPSKPIKPKIPLIVGGGIFAALIVALLTALGAELRAGKIVETWQVQQMALPLLAELRFPPAPTTSASDAPE